jgi:hypothetical protein
MNAPTPSNPVVALAAFVRQRLADMTETLSPLWSRRDEPEALPAKANEGTLAAAKRQLAMVIVGAAAPFAPTSHARVRLLRQMHASGLLTERETEQAVDALGAPR